MKDIKDAFSDDKKETTETPTPLTKTTEIRADMVNEKGQINICLQTGEGKSNRSNIYVGKDLKFSTTGNSVKEAAYHISCPNENVVNITVYYNEFKKDSEKSRFSSPTKSSSPSLSTKIILQSYVIHLR